MTATRTADTNISRNTEIASRFLDRAAALTAADRESIATESFGSSAHTSAMLVIADELTSMKNRDRAGRVTAFLVEAEQRIESMGLGAQLSGLLKAAVRAILVHDLPSCEKSTRTLYAPFEPIIPFQSLTT
jgi:hypothetical protein